MVAVFLRLYLILTTTSPAIMAIPSSGFQEELHVCAGKERILSCSIGEFIWVHYVRLGMSKGITGDSCPVTAKDCTVDAYDSDIWTGSMFQVYDAVRVPDVKMTCDDMTYHRPDYVLVGYNCFNVVLLDPINICSVETQTRTERSTVQLTSPYWPHAFSTEISLECTCRIEPVSGPDISAVLVMMLVRFSEETACGEEISIEDQGGSVLLHQCSPAQRQFFDSRDNVLTNTTAGTTSLQLRYVNAHMAPSPGDPYTTFWFAIQANGPMRVTCGRVNGTDANTTVTMATDSSVTAHTPTTNPAATTHRQHYTLWYTAMIIALVCARSHSLRCAA